MPLNFRKDSFRYQKYRSELVKLYDKKQSWVYTSLILTVLTISFFMIFALRPTLLTIASLFGEIRQKEEAVEELDRKIRQLALAQAAYAQIAPRLYLVDQALPTEANIFPLLRDFEEASGEKEVAFTGLKMEEFIFNYDGEELQPVDFRVSLKGEFVNLRKFFERVFSLRRIIQGLQFDLEQSKDSKETGLIFSAQLQSFFQPRAK